MTRLSGWGRTPVAEGRVRTARSEADVAEAMAEGPLIARGNGRSYGDPAMSPGLTLRMTGMDRMLSFDAATGTLVAEAGVLLSDIIATFLPRGWFLLVTPGTKFVSLGGAIAADVHGKNHHGAGSFRACVDWVDVMEAAGGAPGRTSGPTPRASTDLRRDGPDRRDAARRDPPATGRNRLDPAGDDRRPKASTRPSTPSKRTWTCPIPWPGSTASAIRRDLGAAS
jgi:FAD/FMN-containing dehydrogenase